MPDPCPFCPVVLLARGSREAAGAHTCCCEGQPGPKAALSSVVKTQSAGKMPVMSASRLGTTPCVRRKKGRPSDGSRGTWASGGQPSVARVGTGGRGAGGAGGGQGTVAQAIGPDGRPPTQVCRLGWSSKYRTTNSSAFSGRSIQSLTSCGGTSGNAHRSGWAWHAHWCGGELGGTPASPGAASRCSLPASRPACSRNAAQVVTASKPSASWHQRLPPELARTGAVRAA